MARQIISLNDDRWQVGQVSRRPFDAAQVYDLPAVTEWLPATVPGNVRTDLLALDRILDPFVDEQYKASLWVEEVDWWYRRSVRSALIGPESRAFVVFKGIDYLSAIFIAGHEVTRHQGMFSPQTIEITDALRAGDGQTDVAVRLWGSTALPRRRLSWLQRLWQKIGGALHGSWVGVYPDRSATLKCQMSFGWDFAPPIRTMGLWDDVELIITGPVFIAHVGAAAHPALAAHDTLATVAPTHLTLYLDLDSQQPQQVQAIVSVTPSNFTDSTDGPFHFRLDLPAGQSAHRLQFHLPEAKLWHSWDRGFPHLYRLTVTLLDAKGDPLDEVTIRTGVRSIELDRWQFSLNGQRHFIRGLNWVPADSFPGRLRAENYRRFLTLAQGSGANLLRVWGGGLREKQGFYDLCDELGLLVWQEFPFACMFLGAYPRHPSYLNLVKSECSAIVQQLRHHPSLLLWCGGNEFSRLRNRPLINTLSEIIKQHDRTRPFVTTSPSFNRGHDAHNWHVWHGDAPFSEYQKENAHFLSEFGLQALPHADTLAAALTDPHNPQSWTTHHADLEKLDRYASLFNDQSPAIIHQQSKIHNSHFTIHQSQLSQATALQTAIEHMRRRKGEAGGVCLWQFNEPWPAISWAIVDYFGRSKLAYRQLSNWYNPVLISLNFSVGRRWQPGYTFIAQIWAINDTMKSMTGAQLEIILDSRLIYGQAVNLPPNSAQPVDTLTHRLTAPPKTLKLTLQYESNLICQNSYNLNWHDPSSGSLTRRLRRRVAEWAMR